jgi:Fe2+ or Zn2+ uptake regulation protein
MQYRRSKQRETILEVMQRHGGHLTADQIYVLARPRLPRLSLGTVYRNLRILAAQGRVREIDFGHTSSYFELAKESHYHLICRLCGSIEDAAVPVTKALTALARSSLTRSGFKVEDHRLGFVGICRSCQRKGQRSSKRAKTAKLR